MNHAILTEYKRPYHGPHFSQTGDEKGKHVAEVKRLVSFVITFVTSFQSAALVKIIQTLEANRKGVALLFFVD